MPLLPIVQHPEFPVTSETYLNIYSGDHFKHVDLHKFSHYIDMTKDQRQTFESFVEQVKTQQTEWDLAIVPDELTLLRFLQADKYNPKMALERLRKNQAWLRQVDIPGILQHPPTAKLAIYRKIRARAFMGATKTGMPVFVERLGDFFNGIPSPEGKSLSPQDYVECFLYEAGELLAQIRDSYDACCRQNLPVTWNATWMMDCKNVGLYRASKAVSTLKLLDGLTEPNFPELAGPVMIVSVPSIVSGLYKVCKAFLDATTAAKLKVYSNVPTAELLEFVHAHVLLEEYGGKNPLQVPKAEYS